jgi:hypothetical protein
LPSEISIPTSLAFAVFLALAVFLFFALRSGEERKATLRIALGSYFFKATLIPIYYQYLVYLGLGGFAYFDTVRFHEWGTQMAVEITHDLPHRHWGWTIMSNGYFILVAYIYSLFGPNTILPRLLNAAVTSMSLLYVYRIARDYFDKRTARIAIILAGFLPYSMIIVVEQRKDPIAVFLALMAFYHGTAIIRGSGSQMIHLAWIFLAMVPMYFVRSGFILPFLAVMLFSWVLSRRDLLTAIAAAAPAALLALVIQYVTPEDSQVSVGYSVQRLQGKAEAATTISQTGGGLMRFAYVASPTQIWKAPLSGGLLLITPFPPVLQSKRSLAPSIRALPAIGRWCSPCSRY